MITDAFLEANSTLKIADSISDPEDFLTMTDVLVPIIERSKESSLAGARKIITRLRRRKLYRFVDELLLPAGVSRQITAEDITPFQNVAHFGINLRPEDIYVAHVTLNFGMKSKNPVDNVMFFKDWEDMNPQRISSTKVSYVLPGHFEEKIIRVYLKREYDLDEDRAKKSVKEAFRRFIAHNSLGPPKESSSQLRKRPKHNRNDDITDSSEDDDTGSDSSYVPAIVGTSIQERFEAQLKPTTDVLGDE